MARQTASVIHCTRWRLSIRNSLCGNVSVFSDGTRHGVCLFWRHDGVSASVNSLHGNGADCFDGRMLHQHLYFVGRHRVCLFWRHDSVSALVARCTCRRPMSSICLCFWPLLLRKDSHAGTMRETFPGVFTSSRCLLFLTCIQQCRWYMVMLTKSSG